MTEALEDIVPEVAVAPGGEATPLEIVEPGIEAIPEEESVSNGEITVIADLERTANSHTIKTSFIIWGIFPFLKSNCAMIHDCLAHF